MQHKLHIGSVTMSNKKHGLNIYANFLEKLILEKNTKLSFERYYFSESGTYFLPEKLKKNNAIAADLFLIQFDTSSLFFNVSNLKILWRHFCLCRFIAAKKLPTIIVLHGLLDDPKIPNWISRIGSMMFFNFLLKELSILFVSHSQHEVQQLKKLFPEYRNSFYYIPFLIDPNLIERDKSIKSSSNHRGSRLLVTLGFIGPWKGQRELLKIIKQVANMQKNFFYIIAGKSVDKKYYTECIDFINNNHLTNSVKIINKFLSANEFKHYLLNADIYLDYHTRGKHTGSWTIAYAIAAGKKILTTSNYFTKNKSISKSATITQNSHDYVEQLISVLDKPMATISPPKKKPVLINNEVTMLYLKIFSKLLKRKI